LLIRQKKLNLIYITYPINNSEHYKSFS